MVEFPEIPPVPPRPQPAAPLRAVVPTAVPPALTQADLVASFPSVSPTTDRQFKAFESLVGGRPSLAAKLALLAAGKDEDYVVGLLADPAHDAVSLAALCRKAKIPLRRLMELYRDAALVVGQVQAIDSVAAGLPGVAADVMARSVTHALTCFACNGTGTFTPEPTKDLPNPTPQPCETCKGTGSLTTQPDHEVQKTALTLGGLLGKGSGGVQVHVQQNNQQIVGMGGAGFDGVVEKLDEVLFGAARDRVARSAHTVIEADSVSPVPAAQPEAGV